MTREELLKILGEMPQGASVMFKDLGTDQQPAYVEVEKVFYFNDGESEFIAIGS